VTLIFDFLDIPLSIVFLIVVKEIHEMQASPPPVVAASEPPAIDVA
jgi:hypothetical protein